MGPLKKQPFKVGEREFVIMVAHDKEPGYVVWVETKDGGPVVITRPNGSTVTLSYRVTMDLQHTRAVLEGIDTVDSLMKTAEADVRWNVEQGWA